MSVGQLDVWIKLLTRNSSSLAADRKHELSMRLWYANREIHYFTIGKPQVGEKVSISEANYHLVQLSLITGGDRTMRARVILRNGPNSRRVTRRIRGSRITADSPCTRREFDLSSLKRRRNIARRLGCRMYRNVSL